MADTRSRMVDATIHALQRRGVAGMSFTDVLQDSGAARGAIYHHFPGGKAQLVAEAAARNGEDVRASLATLPAGDPLVVVTAFLDAVRPVLVASTAGGGCAIAAITVTAGEEGRGDADLQRAAADIFASWARILAERLQPAGLPPDEALGLATTLIMLLQGAHILCRATGTLEPFEQAARTATDLTRARYEATPA
ncbi:TetR/AcrR family transcriptional regulator [Frankia sp. AgB1.9]|uniref:TetR/AcrR family transcriptional regulator n=1 Tax=unclassified Frankia TaxID=2632575 RepID=UPI0019312F11|nr:MULTISPECIES: TetR/AcrR family transcriptional regulator [unclassified Frankia]MBL7488077.1 TetR/AcrR family transcriptional regulator [Frankia sp. AgW1.1]MBL7548304.1 TetR/AcrR family transcriptional regulator [Frankia sp. AgB1.9]MBL7625217.1 TetR/AcrR family transcriptional regulator [Frankia sp. AgB1.8]